MGYEMAIFTLLGLVVGSFLNVCIDRLPAGGSLVHPRSHCSVCGHRLAIKDLIPVFSYIRLRGRCRYCQSPIPRRSPLVELATGLVFTLIWWWYGLSPELGVMSFYWCVLIIILVIDLEHKLILNRLVYPVIAITLVIAIFIPEPGIINSLIGLGVGFATMFVLALIFRGGIGWGDVKMAGLIGAMVGFPMVLVALLLAIVGGGLVAIFLLALKIRKRKEAMAFGPFLSVATMAVFLWGYGLLDWYLGLF